MRHLLAAITPTGSNLAEAQLMGLRQLSEKEWECFGADIQEVNRFRHHLQIFDMFERNVAALFVLLDAILESADADRFSEVGLEEVFLESDRHLLNILTMLRAFVDHASATLSRTFGADSRELAQFKAACSREYDSHFAYRFLSRLRNYAQHCGLPTDTVRVRSRSKLAPPLTGSGHASRARTHQQVVLLFDRDSLLSGYDGWGPVAEHIRGKSEKIEIVTLVIHCRNCVRRLARRFASTMSKKARPAGRRLASLIKEIAARHPTLAPAVMSIPKRSRSSPETLKTTLHHFPVGAMIRLGIIQLGEAPA